jgi:cation transport ATPase
VPDVASVSGLSILDCFLCCIVFLCFAGLRPVSCVPNFASISGLFITKSGTQETGRRPAKHKNTIQHRKHSRMDNPETLAKSATPRHMTKTSKTQKHNKTQKTIKNGQPRDTGNIRHTEDEDQQNTKTQYNTENMQEWTTKRHWQNQAQHKTQDEDEQNLCFCVLLVVVLCVPDVASVSGLSILDCFLCFIVFLCFACLRHVSWCG